MSHSVSSDSDDSDFFERKEESIIRNIEFEGKLIAEKILPAKSCLKYELAYSDFLKWVDKRHVTEYTENVSLVYFQELSKSMKPSSLWSRWSMLKTTLRLRSKVNLDDYYNLRAFLKNFSKGYKVKKAKVFTLSQVMVFLNKSEDSIYLSMKVILIFGICGALRCHELCNLKLKDIEDTNNQFIVTISDTKNYYPRIFVIGPQFYQIVKRYILLRPTDFESDRFFLTYQKGKCIRNVMGKNKISGIPRNIALYLNLENSEQYTGHSFRRTGATLLSNSGANLVDIKSLGGWKSDTVAQGYIENSLMNKRKIFEGIINSEKISMFPNDVNLANTSTSKSSESSRQLPVISRTTTMANSINGCIESNEELGQSLSLQDIEIVSMDHLVTAVKPTATRIESNKQLRESLSLQEIQNITMDSSNKNSVVQKCSTLINHDSEQLEEKKNKKVPENFTQLQKKIKVSKIDQDVQNRLDEVNVDSYGAKFVNCQIRKCVIKNYYSSKTGGDHA